MKVLELVALGEQATNKTAQKAGDSYRLPCWNTSHLGKNYNLKISPGDDRVLLHCFSRDCDPKDIMESLGLSIKDIYYQPLNKDQARQYKATTTDRQLRSELQHELTILLAWISDVNRGVFPDGENAKEITELALRRVNKETYHFIEAGV